MSAPRVSILVPSFQQAAFLDEAIGSILEQDYPDLEVIVVDGGSTDGSVDVIRPYSDRLAWWVSEPDEGQVDALRKGFAHATGEILGWVNSDDTLLPGAVAAAVEALVEDPELLLVYGDNVLLDERSRELGLLPARPFDLLEMLRTCQNPVPQPGSLLRRRALELQPLDERGFYYFDFELVLGLALHGRARRLERPLGGYRLHPASKSVAATTQKAEDHLRVVDAFFSRDDLPPEVRAVEHESRSRSELVAGEYFYAGLELRHARRHLLRGLRLDPRSASPRTLSIVARTFLPVALVRRLRERRR